MSTKNRKWKHNKLEDYCGDKPCIYCGLPAKYMQKNGSALCSPHYRKCKGYKKMREEKFIQKYGVKCLMDSPAFQDKIKQGNILKFGTTTPFENPEILQKAKNTHLSRYGVPNPFQTDETKYKIKQTNIEKYGFENVSNNEAIKLKKRNTTIKNYGVSNPTQSDIVQTKIRKTNLERYGYERPMQNSIIARKSFTSAMMSKKFILPSQQKISLMGYEHFALDDLLFSGFKERDFDFDLQQFPKFSYTNENGKKSYYTPDFFVPRLNWVIEVKSTYTFELEKSRNIAKYRALKEAGYTVNFLIITPNHPKLRLLTECSRQSE